MDWLHWGLNQAEEYGLEWEVEWSYNNAVERGYNELDAVNQALTEWDLTVFEEAFQGHLGPRYIVLHELKEI